MMEELLENLKECDQDQEIKVIVLRSEGDDTFCAGASFDEFKKLKTASDAAEYFMGFAIIVKAICSSSKFVITRVQGRAVGGALGLIAASDYVFAVNSASLKLSELSLGIGPFVVEPVIRKKIGLASVSAMTIDTEWRDAAWAYQQGLYQHLSIDQKGMDEEISKLSNKLVDCSASAMSEIKKMFAHDVEEMFELMKERAEINGKLLVQRSL